MKKVWITVVLFFLCPVFCAAENTDEYRLSVNGKCVDTIKPILERNGQTFLSATDVVRLLDGDYEIRINQTDCSLMILENGSYHYLKENRHFCIAEGRPVYLDETPFTEGEEWYLPASVCSRITGWCMIQSKRYLQFFKWSLQK